MSQQRSQQTGGLFQHLILEAVALLIIAFVQLIALRGFMSFPGMLFVVGPIVCAFAARRDASLGIGTQRLGTAFLLSIVIGSIVAELPWPKLPVRDPALPRAANRLLAWYAGTYVLFLLIIPTYIFLRNLSLHRHGKPAYLSRFTCWLGLFCMMLLVLGLVAGLEDSIRRGVFKL